MDETDSIILDILKEDGRASYTRIAEEIGVSEGTVRNRVDRMLEEGVIDRFTVEVSPREVVEAFVMVDVSTGTDISDLVSDFPGNSEIYELAGEHDIIVRLSGESSAEVNDAVDLIRELPGVESTTTYMVLNRPH